MLIIFLMGQYAEYLDQLSQKLAGEGFSIGKGVTADKYRFDIVAARSAVEVLKFGKMTRFIIASTLDNADSAALQDYSSQATKYALENRNSILPRGFGGSLLSIPVLVSDDFGEDLKMWAVEHLMEKHWSAFEFPVLVSPGTRRIYYCKKTPLLGAAYYKGDGMLK
jgi:hypothetical protein